MEYLEFERILSAKRMQRYKDAANGDTRKAMALYRYNLRLSQEKNHRDRYIDPRVN